MNQKLPQPKDGDVVLGGTSIDISTAVVLGGIEGVKRDLQSNIESVQLSGLQKALNYAKEGIALIQQVLKHPNVSLRLKAFELLKGQSTYLQQAQEHKQLKKTGWGNGNISKQKKEDDFRITEEQSCRLGEALVIELNKIYQATPTDSQIRAFLSLLIKIIKEVRLFPDVDTYDIWYTDHFDIIQYAKLLELGDISLSHWPEEENQNGRYLELTKEELVKILMLMLQVPVNNK
jgi:hypothetical protein